MKNGSDHKSKTEIAFQYMTARVYNGKNTIRIHRNMKIHIIQYKNYTNSHKYVDLREYSRGTYWETEEIHLKIKTF